MADLVHVQCRRGKSAVVPGDVTAMLARSGFALLKNALPDDLANGSLFAMARLFELPDSIKQGHSARAADDAGYIAHGRHRDRRNGAPSLLESWNFRRIEDLPDRIRPVAAAIHRLRGLLVGHALAVLGAIERHLDIAEGLLAGLVDSRSMAMTLLHYPGELAAGSTGCERQFFHKDASFITLIPPTCGSGLCIRDGEAFRPCEPTGGDVLVLVGASLEYVSEGMFRAREHGVVAPHAGDPSDRYSSPLFISPSGSSKVTSVGAGGSQNCPIGRAELFDRYLPTHILADEPQPASRRRPPLSADRPP